MRRLFTLALGGAVGYVLGAKAGRSRYDQIVAMARKWTRGQGRTAGSTWTDGAGSSSGTGMATGMTGSTTTSAPTFGEPFETPSGP